MLAALPNPILSVTPEGVRELDGREALSGLWTLFTKCKDSIENGRRLENISWRLWYRDMFVPASPRRDDRTKPKFAYPFVKEERLSEKTYRPPTPMETAVSPPSDQDVSRQLAANPLLYPGITHSIIPPAASQSIPRRHQLHADVLCKPRKQLAVGQIICEMLPNTTNVTGSPATSPSFISLSMSPTYGGVTRIPRSERFAPLPASPSRSEAANFTLHMSGSAFLPLLPLLPLPEPSPNSGMRAEAPSQLPTPGTERDESAPFDTAQISSTSASHTKPVTGSGTASESSISPHPDPSIHPITAPAGAPSEPDPPSSKLTCPPSPSLSDSYVRAHPNEISALDHPQSIGIPGIEIPVQPPSLSHMHSEPALERSSQVSSDPQLCAVPTLNEDTPTPVVATPPRLVVVNPTPGPTPHPTPPATPLSFMPSVDSGRLRPQSQFLAPPPLTRLATHQPPLVPATNASQDDGNTRAGVIRGPTTCDPISVPDPRSRSTTHSVEYGTTLPQAQTEPPRTHPPRLQSTPPTQDPATAVEAIQLRHEESSIGNAIPNQVPASQNPHRLSTGSTTSSSSTGVTNISSDASSSQLSLGATSINTDVSTGQHPGGNGSSDELKSVTSMGVSEHTITALTSSPQEVTVESPISPTRASPRASTSVTSIKSTKSAVSTGTRANRNVTRPGLMRRASSGAASSGGRSRKAGHPSTTNRATSNSSDSRSGSREAVSRKDVAAGALAATLGMTTAPGPSGGARKRMGGKAGGKSRAALARTVSRGGGLAGGAALNRTLSHEEIEEVTDEDDAEEMAAAVAREAEQNAREQAEKEQREREAAAREAAIREKERQVIAGASRAKFKFGSNSDNGSNAGTEISSRAPGSELYGGYDAKGKGRDFNLAAQERRADELRQRELAVQRAREAAAVLESEKQAKQEQTRKEAEAIAKARAQESVADPLLPQGSKRTILLTSESDYTDTDDESWTSEDVEDGAPVEAPTARQQPPSERQSSHQESRQHLQHAQQHPQQHQPPPAVQRTHSNTSGAGRTSRREWQHIQQRREAQLRVQRAAAQLQREEEEKQRQREMFAKKPTTSFQNLTDMDRTRSSGLLTQLMNPDPSIFPSNHPYRRGHSSGDVQQMGTRGMAPMTAMTPAVQPQPQRTQSQPLQQQQKQIPYGQRATEPQCKPAPPVAREKPSGPSEQQHHKAPRERAQPRRASTLDSKLMPPPPPPVTTAAAPVDKTTAAPPSPVRSERRAPSVTNVAVQLALRGMRTLGFGSGKSSTAGPMASQVIAGSVNTNQAAKVAAAPPRAGPDTRSPGSSGGVRPKGPLPDQEMDTDSEDEVEENHLQLSKSVAQDRLKQFAARRGIAAAGSTLPAQPENDETPPWARQEPNGRIQAEPQQPVQPAALTPAPGPIPVMHPYNLPVNAVPSTPRTTRRQMLRNEMSESLRRQLLWERQQAGVPIRRTTSTGHVGPQRNNTLNGLKPLTTTPSMVQLHAKGAGTRQQSHLRQEVAAGGNDTIRGSGERERRASSRASTEDAQEQRRQALARNRSWTNDYHTSGW